MKRQHGVFLFLLNCSVCRTLQRSRHSVMEKSECARLPGARRDRLVFMERSLTALWTCLLGVGLILGNIHVLIFLSVPLVVGRYKSSLERIADLLCK